MDCLISECFGLFIVNPLDLSSPNHPRARTHPQVETVLSFQTHPPLCFVSQLPNPQPTEIDIVLGGPPCQDYSGTNSRRQGVYGENGRYLPAMGRLIKKLQARQPKRPIYFIAESVPLRGDDLKAAEDAFGVPGLLLDSKDLSPCRRNRHYFINVSW